MSDKVNIDQFRGILYRPTPRLNEKIVDYELSIRTPQNSTLHSIPREELLETAQRNINRYRSERDAGPEGIADRKAGIIKTALQRK
jgi:hypothetical protein